MREVACLPQDDAPGVPYRWCAGDVRELVPPDLAPAELRGHQVGAARRTGCGPEMNAHTLAAKVGNNRSLPGIGPLVALTTSAHAPAVLGVGAARWRPERDSDSLPSAPAAMMTALPFRSFATDTLATGAAERELPRTVSRPAED